MRFSFSIAIIPAFVSFIVRLGAPRSVTGAFCTRAPRSFDSSVILSRTRKTYRSMSLEASEEDLGRWERMYNEGRTSYTNDADITDYIAPNAGEIRVVTFDLDNTLWRTSATIAEANDALAAFLDQHNITHPVRVEKVMGQLFRASKQRYSPQEGNDAKAPVLLTRLRKDAIQQLLTQHNDYSNEDATDFAEQAFQVWTEARHEAIPQHYATSVVTSLERIGSMRTSSGQPVLVGAITDGNSDPRNIPELREFFDFCVNAEGVGVSKPDKRVYLEAINQVAAHAKMNDVFGAMKQDGLYEEAIEDMVGPWWVHIGDDFVKDVVASKGLKMRSIWSRELVNSSALKTTESRAPTKKLEEFVKEVSEMKVVEMEVGAEDYLVDSLRQEFADAVVDSFEDLHGILVGWQSPATRDEDRLDRLVEEGGGAGQKSPIGESMSEPRQSAKGATLSQTDEKQSHLSLKFCMYCGVKLPLGAKFCSSCGEKQEQL